VRSGSARSGWSGRITGWTPPPLAGIHYIVGPYVFPRDNYRHEHHTKETIDCGLFELGSERARFPEGKGNHDEPGQLPQELEEKHREHLKRIAKSKSCEQAECAQESDGDTVHSGPVTVIEQPRPLRGDKKHEHQ
jgi:hypothetical protein